MKLRLTLLTLLFTGLIYSQVNADSLFLKNRSFAGTFASTVECETDSIGLALLDTGSAGNFEYSWTFYRADSIGTRLQPLLSSPYMGGQVGYSSMQSGLDSVKKLKLPHVILQLNLRDNVSTDSAVLPIRIRNISPVKRSYIKTFGGLVFTQKDELDFSTAFPGPWIAPLATLPNIVFENGYYDAYSMRLEEYNSSGNRLREVALRSPFNDTVTVVNSFRALKNLKLGVSVKDTTDFFMNNTAREYYRFTFYYQVEGCGWDSVYTYFRLITPNEIDLPELTRANLSVYPNPTKDVVVVSADDDIENVALFDLQGQELEARIDIITSSEMRLSIGSFDPGIYILRIRTNEKWVYRKVEVR